MYERGNVLYIFTVVFCTSALVFFFKKLRKSGQTLKPERRLTYSCLLQHMPHQYDHIVNRWDRKVPEWACMCG